MELPTGHFIQLAAALVAAGVVFVLAYLLPLKVTVSALILLIPFQIIQSQYGTLNMVLTYVVGAALFIRGDLTKFPLLAPFTFLMLAYLASLTLSPTSNNPLHVTYLISIGANILLFYITYNFIRERNDVHLLIDLIVTMNVMVLVYCTILLFWGSERIVLLDIEEFGLNRNRPWGSRLRGPFTMVDATGEYALLQTLLLMYLLIYVKSIWRRNLLRLLIAGNLAVLVGVASRGVFLSLVFGAIIFAFVFRRELGGRGIMLAGTSGIIILIVVTVTMNTFTEYGSLFVRLSETQIEGVLPDTRTVEWPRAWERIQERPLFGYGPRIRLRHDANISYPHSLYLYVLLTLGVTGFLAYVYFWGAIYGNLWRARRNACDDALIDHLPLLGLVVITAFLVDQIKIEFLRHSVSDYRDYIFMMVALFLAASHVGAKKQNASTGVVEEE